jgi:hypothetical protein
VPRTDTVLAHQPLDPAQTDAAAPVVTFSAHASPAVGGLDFGMTASHQGHRLGSSSHDLARLDRLHPGAQRLLDQAQ